MENIRKGVQWVLDNRTSYQVAKDLGITNRTVNRYQNGESPLENMTFGTAEKIYNYYLKEMAKMWESLDQAIEDFNSWDHAAMLYFNKDEGYFNTEVFSNDIQAGETFLTDGNYGIYSKSDRASKRANIGEARKEYIIDFAKLIMDGYDSMQAQYELADKYPPHI